MRKECLISWFCCVLNCSICCQWFISQVIVISLPVPPGHWPGQIITGIIMTSQTVPCPGADCVEELWSCQDTLWWKRKIWSKLGEKKMLLQKFVSPALLRGIPRIELGTSRTRSEHYATKPNPRLVKLTKTAFLKLWSLWAPTYYLNICKVSNFCQPDSHTPGLTFLSCTNTHCTYFFCILSAMKKLESLQCTWQQHTFCMLLLLYSHCNAFSVFGWIVNHCK